MRSLLRMALLVGLLALPLAIQPAHAEGGAHADALLHAVLVDPQAGDAGAAASHRGPRAAAAALLAKAEADDLRRLCQGDCGLIDNADLRRYCRGDCGLIDQPDLRRLCGGDCGLIDHADVRRLCRGDCGLIDDADLRRFCRGDCGLIDNANMRRLCQGSCGLISG